MVKGAAAWLLPLCVLTLQACSAGEKGEAARADWAHVFLSVLPQLPLSALADEGRIAAALRAAGATVMARYGAGLRRAAVAQWEVRLPVPDASGAWRLVVSSPTGESHLQDPSPLQNSSLVACRATTVTGNFSTVFT